MARTVAASCLAALLALVLVATAFAHAEPATIKPGDKAVLNQPPAQIDMTMSQEMARQGDANDIDVFDASGKEVTVVAAVIDNSDRKKLSVPLPTGLPAGIYTVKWKTLSADDGDAAEGMFTFTIDPSAAPNAGTEAVKPPVLDDKPPETGSVASITNSAGGGTSWVLVTAVAIGAFVLGGGTTFLAVQKRG
jgi:methionine-rich copper-binding protein CopC